MRVCGLLVCCLLRLSFEVAVVGGCFYRGRKKGCVGEGLWIGGLGLLPDLEDR